VPYRSCWQLQTQGFADSFLSNKEERGGILSNDNSTVVKAPQAEVLKGEDKRKIVKFITALILVISIIITLIHVYSAGVRFFPPYQQRPLHLACVLVLLFLVYPFRKKDEGKINWTVWLNIFLSIVGVLSCAYVFVYSGDIALRMGKLITLDLVVAVALLVLVLEGCRRVIGWGLVGVVFLFLAYAFWGDMLPRAVAHSGYSFQRTIQQISLSMDGLFGTSLGVSATSVSMFLIFGAFLQASGAGQVFINIALSLFGRFRGGAGKTALGASALFALVSPSQVANVATTGVFTIPLMEKVGYPKLFSAGLVASAGAGGMLTPPLLGAAAFLMADLLGVPYKEVVIAAIIPAFLYYVSLFMQVDIRSAKLNMTTKSTEGLPDLKKTFNEGAHLLLPIVVLIVCLFVLNLTPARSAFWGTVSVPVISWLRRGTRMTWGKFLTACKSGAKMITLIGVSCGTAGFVLGVVYQTGLALRFTGWMVTLAGGSLLILLFLTMVSSIILGLGLPPVASYLLLAILGGPALIKMGVTPMAAHMFIFFYGSLSEITPPSCTAAFTAGAIAKIDPMRTGWEACRVAIAAFIIPFMFVYGNELILMGSVLNIIIAVATAIIGVIALACSLEGYIFFSRISIIERIILFSVTVLCASVGYIQDLIGIAIFAAIILFRYFWKKNKDRAIGAGA